MLTLTLDCVSVIVIGETPWNRCHYNFICNRRDKWATLLLCKPSEKSLLLPFSLVRREDRSVKTVKCHFLKPPWSKCTLISADRRVVELDNRCTLEPGLWIPGVLCVCLCVCVLSLIRAKHFDCVSLNQCRGWLKGNKRPQLAKHGCLSTQYSKASSGTWKDK